MTSLRWFVANQLPNGSWSNSVEDTSVILIAFLAHGETPTSETFGKTVEAAIRYLVGKQQEDGWYSKDPEVHAKAVYAMGETYGMTQVPVTKQSVEKGLKVLIEYQARQEQLSIWHIHALKSAKMAGLELDELEQAFSNSVKKIENAPDEQALLGLQLLGHGRAKRCQDVLKSLENVVFDLSSEKGIDYWRCVTEAKFDRGGDTWNKWNRDFSRKLVGESTVIKGGGPNGKDLSYWEPRSRVDKAKGEIYLTAGALSMLEVYYRYLPTFKAPSETSAGVPSTSLSVSPEPEGQLGAEKIPWQDMGLNDEIWIVEKSDTPEDDDAERPAQGELRVVVKDKEIPLPLKHTEVKAKIAGFISSVAVTQQYENPYDTKIETVYVFPLPESAAVTDFVMTIGTRRIRGLIREKEEAQKIYQEAKDQGFHAALLTQERPNVFTQKIANIEPGKRIDVSITYFNPLAYRDGAYEFVFPMVVGPRFNPPNSTNGIGAVERNANGSSGQSTEVQYLKPGERNGHDLSLTVDIDAGVRLEGISSSSHAINTERPSETRAVVSLKSNETIPNKDFVLNYKVAGNKIKTAVMVDRRKTGNTLALVLQPPEQKTDVPRMPREMVFVLDCSGSMSGAPIQKVKQAVKRCLVNLDKDDTFQIVEFCDQATTLAKKPVPATRKNIERALTYVDQLDAGGGTMAIEGVKAALDFPHDPKRLRVVSFMTDGYIGNETEILAAIKQKLGSSRIFSFGIGSSVNRYLIEGMASFGKGAAAFVGLDDKAGDKVDLFYDRIAHPALMDVNIDWGHMKVTDVYPRSIPDVFLGRPVMVVGRFEGKGQQTIKVTGRTGDGNTTYTINVDLDDNSIEHQAISSVWARWKIKDLSDDEVCKPTKELQEEITQMSIGYNLISRYTAFLAVDSAEKTDGKSATTVNVPVPVPDGVKYDTTVQEAP